MAPCPRIGHYPGRGEADMEETMKAIGKLAVAAMTAAAAAVVATSALAQDCVWWDRGPTFGGTIVTSYAAYISAQDLRASDGYPLTEIRQILRQDRANLHRFGRPDPYDEWDGFFGSADNRAVFDQAQIIYYCDWTPGEIASFNRSILSADVEGRVYVTVFRRVDGAWRILIEAGA